MTNDKKNDNIKNILLKIKEENIKLQKIFFKNLEKNVEDKILNIKSQSYAVSKKPKILEIELKRIKSNATSEQKDIEQKLTFSLNSLVKNYVNWDKMSETNKAEVKKLITEIMNQNKSFKKEINIYIDKKIKTKFSKKAAKSHHNNKSNDIKEEIHNEVNNYYKNFVKKSLSQNDEFDWDHFEKTFSKKIDNLISTLLKDFEISKDQANKAHDKKHHKGDDTIYVVKNKDGKKFEMSLNNFKSDKNIEKILIDNNTVLEYKRPTKKTSLFGNQKHSKVNIEKENKKLKNLLKDIRKENNSIKLEIEDLINNKFQQMIDLQEKTMSISSEIFLEEALNNVSKQEIENSSEINNSQFDEMLNEIRNIETKIKNDIDSVKDTIVEIQNNFENSDKSTQEIDLSKEMEKKEQEIRNLQNQINGIYSNLEKIKLNEKYNEINHLEFQNLQEKFDNLRKKSEKTFNDLKEAKNKKSSNEMQKIFNLQNQISQIRKNFEEQMSENENSSEKQEIENLKDGINQILENLSKLKLQNDSANDEEEKISNFENQISQMEKNLEEKLVIFNSKEQSDIQKVEFKIEKLINDLAEAKAKAKENLKLNEESTPDFNEEEEINKLVAEMEKLSNKLSERKLNSSKISSEHNSMNQRNIESENNVDNKINANENNENLKDKIVDVIWSGVNNDNVKNNDEKISNEHSDSEKPHYHSSHSNVRGHVHSVHENNHISELDKKMDKMDFENEVPSEDNYPDSESIMIEILHDDIMHNKVVIRDKKGKVRDIIFPLTKYTKENLLIILHNKRENLVGNEEKMVGHSHNHVSYKVKIKIEDIRQHKMIIKHVLLDKRVVLPLTDAKKLDLISMFNIKIH